jgi:hypothetical protein
VAYWAKPLGISCCDGCNMPTFAPTIVGHSQGIRSRVVAKSAGSVFTSMGVLLNHHLVPQSL